MEGGESAPICLDGGQRLPANNFPPFNFLLCNGNPAAAPLFWKACIFIGGVLVSGKRSFPVRMEVAKRFLKPFVVWISWNGCGIFTFYGSEWLFSKGSEAFFPISKNRSTGISIFDDGP